MMRRKRFRCGVEGCPNGIQESHEEDTVSYFRLPKEPCRAKLWFDAIGGKENPRLMVCDRHFESNFISVNHRLKRLVETAVPSLNLPPRAPTPEPDLSVPVPPTPAWLAPEPSFKQEPPDDDSPEIDIFVKEETTVSQKRPHEAADSSNPPFKRVKREDKDPTLTPKRLAELTTLNTLSTAHLQPELAQYIEALVQLQQAGLSRDNKYDKNLSFFALKLYHSFPQSYKLMHKALGLPTMAQIKRLFRPLRWVLTEQWVRLLRARFAGASPEQRECVVMVAHAPLRPALAYAAARDRLHGLHELGAEPHARAARSAVLLVARGVHARWRQPLACGLLGAGTPASALRAWIQSVILKLFDLKLTVRALITDFDESFVPTGPIVTAERPYFTVNDKQIYCFYDCTQLMTSFQNYFMAYNINYGGMVASWEDIEEMYEYNSTRAYPLPTGLTAEHLKPPQSGPARRRARLAVQALARPVAAALAAAVDLRVLADAAHGTVQVVVTVADLYDTMHNKSLSFGCKAAGRDKAADGSVEIKSLNEMIARLEKMSLADKAQGHAAGDPGLLAAMRAGVHAALALHERVRRAGGRALPMRAFNNDPLHAFLDRVRARNGGRIPTSQHMLAAFKRNFVFNIMKPFRTSPEVGLVEFLSAASEMWRVPLAAPEPAAPELLVPAEEWSALLRASHGRRSAPVLARQLLARCLARHGGCELARVYCNSPQLPAGLLRYMELMSYKFTAYFKDGGAAEPGLVAALLQMMADEPFEAPCSCFPTYELKIMFFRFKIRALIEFNNNRFRRNQNAEFLVNMKYALGADELTGF